MAAVAGHCSFVQAEPVAAVAGRYSWNEGNTAVLASVRVLDRSSVIERKNEKISYT